LQNGEIATDCNKIALGFTSTGQSSAFLDVAEVDHGDFGSFSPSDPTVLLSKSDTIDEILCLIPVLKNVESKIISIVEKANSRIAKFSDVVIAISFRKNADLLQTVPTTSLIDGFAIGDAMAPN
jgi:arabinose-5-phosphate isomerase